MTIQCEELYSTCCGAERHSDVPERCGACEEPTGFEAPDPVDCECGPEPEKEVVE
jgi:hypothetical protein